MNKDNKYTISEEDFLKQKMMEKKVEERIKEEEVRKKIAKQIERGEYKFNNDGKLVKNENFNKGYNSNYRNSNYRNSRRNDLDKNGVPYSSRGPSARFSDSMIDLFSGVGKFIADVGKITAKKLSEDNEKNSKKNSNKVNNINNNNIKSSSNYDSLSKPRNKPQVHKTNLSKPVSPRSSAKSFDNTLKYNGILSKELNDFKELCLSYLLTAQEMYLLGYSVDVPKSFDTFVLREVYDFDTSNYSKLFSRINTRNINLNASKIRESTVSNMNTLSEIVVRQDALLDILFTKNPIINENDLDIIKSLVVEFNDLYYKELCYLSSLFMSAPYNYAMLSDVEVSIETGIKDLKKCFINLFKLGKRITEDNKNIINKNRKLDLKERKTIRYVEQVTEDDC